VDNDHNSNCYAFNFKIIVVSLAPILFLHLTSFSLRVISLLSVVLLCYNQPFGGFLQTVGSRYFTICTVFFTNLLG